MNKTELIEAMASRTELGKKDAEKALNAFMGIITENLVKKEKVQLVGFGTFETVDKPARECRNPATGETVKIPATTAPKLKFGKTLKDAVAGKK